MNTQGWFRRLAAQLPGWHAWYTSSGGTGRGWYAVPAPDAATHTAALTMPNRIGPYPTPQALRSAARERYGWDERCDTCGCLARLCGHRQPEHETAHP